MCLVLILSFGPFSQIEKLDVLLKSPRLVQANFQSNDWPVIIAIESPVLLNLNIVEQTAPIFAGAKQLPSQTGNNHRNAPRQKYKLKGIIVNEEAIMPTTSQISSIKETDKKP